MNDTGATNDVRSAADRLCNAAKKSREAAARLHETAQQVLREANEEIERRTSAAPGAPAFLAPKMGGAR